VKVAEEMSDNSFERIMEGLGDALAIAATTRYADPMTKIPLLYPAKAV
jgi:hypothetical protein